MIPAKTYEVAETMDRELIRKVLGTAVEKLMKIHLSK